jgi:hypothetical protein
MLSFSPKVRKELGFYVYAYLDPRTRKPFYLEKGKDDRVLKHLSSRGSSRKAEILRELAQLGLKPIIEILKYRLSEAEALLVESTAIDLLGIEELTNEVRGHERDYGRRGSIEEIEAVLGAKEVDIRGPAVFINIRKSFRYGMQTVCRKVGSQVPSEGFAKFNSIRQLRLSRQFQPQIAVRRLAT